MDIAQEVAEAIERRDLQRLRLLLHPYLHWTDGSSATVRGRTNVMSLLLDAGGVAPPRSYELRDGQVYRWEQAGADG